MTKRHQRLLFLSFLHHKRVKGINFQFSHHVKAPWRQKGKTNLLLSATVISHDSNSWSKFTLFHSFLLSVCQMTDLFDYILYGTRTTIFETDFPIKSDIFNHLITELRHFYHFLFHLSFLFITGDECLSIPIWWWW